MSLDEYLDKIDIGEPINFGAFRKRLPKHLREDAQRYFQVFPVSRLLSHVVPSEEAIISELRAYAIRPEDRVQASVVGNSHSVGTSVAYLLVFNEAGDHIRPDVVAVSGSGGDHDFEPKEQVLIIENEESFSRYSAMLDLASQWYGQDFSISNTDVILAAGNRINKQVTLNWLADTYTRIECAFDYDLGGLKMFHSLSAAIPNASFLCPDSLEPYEAYFKMHPRTNARLQEAMKLAQHHGLDQLVQIFSRSRRFMEQEALLHGVVS